MKEKVVKYAFWDAVGTVVYVVFIATLIYFLGRSGLSLNHSVIISISMLLLFVFSAAFTGLLVFGRPVAWYFNGKKKEALSLVFYTLGIFLILTIVAFIFLIFVF